MNRPDVLDPLVEAKLEGLGHRLQIKFDRQFKELQGSIQQQGQGEGQRQAIAAAAAAEAAAGACAAAARLAAVEEQIQLQVQQQQQTESTAACGIFWTHWWSKSSNRNFSSSSKRNNNNSNNNCRSTSGDKNKWQRSSRSRQVMICEARRDKLMEQIQSSCGQAQLDYLDNPVSLLSAQVSRISCSRSLLSLQCVMQSRTSAGSRQHLQGVA